MVKPIDITGTVIVPKPQPYQDKAKSFFIGHVDQVIEPITTDIEVDTKDKIKQPHLDNSEIKNTEWKDLY
jgi:hypothetical protein